MGAKKQKIVVEGRICGLVENDAIFDLGMEGTSLEWSVRRAINRYFPKKQEEHPEGYWEQRQAEEAEKAKHTCEPTYEVNPYVRTRKDGEVSFGVVKMDDSKEEPKLVRDFARDPFIVYSNKIILD